MYTVLFYQTVENYKEKRTPFREQHLAYAAEYHERGLLLLAGAYDEPADGAMLVFKANDSKLAENFAKNDPYVIHGLIKGWFVRKWNVVIGDNPSIIK